MIQAAVREIKKEIAEGAIYCTVFDYVKATFGESFDVVSASFVNKDNDRIFEIYRQFLDLDGPIRAGQIKVNVSTGQVIALTADEIWNIQARAETRAEHKRGRNPARDENGLILPYQAKIKVNAYMGGYVAFYATSDGQPVLLSGDPPIWRVETVLRLRQYGKVANLGFLDVNAITAEVVPLSDTEIQNRQKRAEDAAIIAKYATAARI